MLNKYLKQHVLARRLITAMVLFSTFITLISSGYQIYEEYRSDVTGIESRLDEIRRVHLQSIVAGMWTANSSDLNRILKNLLSLPDISYLSITEGERVILTVGQPLTNKVIKQELPLSYTYKNKNLPLGKLTVHATLSDVYERAIHHGITILVSNGIKTFLVVGLVLFLFYQLVTRHLETISAYTEDIAINKPQALLELSRRKNTNNPSDELDRVVTAINDMQTRMYSAYRELQESEQLFRLLAENIHSVFWIGSSDWQQVYYISPAFEDIWAQSCNSLYQNPLLWLKSVHPSDRQIVKADIESRIKGEQKNPFVPEYRIIRPDGEIRWISARAFPIVDASGKVDRIVGMAEDISERKESELKLAQSESRFRSLMEAAADGIITVNQQGRIIMANQAAHNMFGYGMGELLNQPVNLLVQGQDSEHDQHMQSFWYKPERRSLKSAGTIYGMRKDSSTIPLEISLTPLETEEGLIVSAMLHDLTDSLNASKKREQLQLQLQQSQKMEAIGQLTGGIAHDFNNILTAILGYTSLASENIDSGKTDKLKNYLAEIEIAGNRARDLVRQMLIFSRNDQREIQELDLSILARETLRTLQSTIPSSIHVKTNFGSSLPGIIGDPIQLHQVLINLVVNARDAMQGKGKLNVQLSYVEEVTATCDSCHERISGEYIKLTVSDSGHGISPEILGKIFDPFFTTKERGKGTGMGLATVHGIVHSHHGHIKVSSGSNGTTFKLYLPVDNLVVVDNNRDVPLSVPIQSEAGAANGNILVVDDEAAIVSMLSTLLVSHGYTVTTATDGATALEVFKQDPYRFDLIITDQTMPKLTGLELAKSILTCRRDTPIIMCTGHSEYVNEQVATNGGIRKFYYKPLDSKSLLATVSRILIDRKVA